MVTGSGRHELAVAATSAQQKRSARLAGRFLTAWKNRGLTCDDGRVTVGTDPTQSEPAERGFFPEGRGNELLLHGNLLRETVRI